MRRRIAQLALALASAVAVLTEQAFETPEPEEASHRRDAGATRR